MSLGHDNPETGDEAGRRLVIGAVTGLVHVPGNPQPLGRWPRMAFRRVIPGAGARWKRAGPWWARAQRSLRRCQWRWWRRSRIRPIRRHPLRALAARCPCHSWPYPSGRDHRARRPRSCRF